MDLHDRLEAISDEEFCKFERVAVKLSQRSDLHAFMLLDRLMPGDDDRIIAAASHDIIYLGVDTEKLNAIITDEQVIDLCRCGVHWSDDSLAMFS